MRLREGVKGTADLMVALPARDIPVAKRIPQLEFLEAVDNHFSRKRPLLINSMRPPFKDNLKFRQAVLHAIDGQAMARVLSPGLGRAHPYTLVPGQIGYDPRVPYHEFNPDKARALLREAGIQTPVQVRMTVHARELDQRQAQVIQAMLGKVGIQVNIELIDPTAWAARIRSGDWELATAQDGADAAFPDAFRFDPLERANPPGLQDTLNRADAESNARRRHDLLVEAQKIVYDGAWMGWMWLNPGNFLINKRLQGFRPPWQAFREFDPLWLNP